MIQWIAISAAVVGFCLVAFKAGVLLYACAEDALCQNKDDSTHG